MKTKELKSASDLEHQDIGKAPEEARDDSESKQRRLACIKAAMSATARRKRKDLSES